MANDKSLLCEWWQWQITVVWMLTMTNHCCVNAGKWQITVVWMMAMTNHCCVNNGKWQITVVWMTAMTDHCCVNVGKWHDYSVTGTSFTDHPHRHFPSQSHHSRIILTILCCCSHCLLPARSRSRMWCRGMSGWKGWTRKYLSAKKKLFPHHHAVFIPCRYSVNTEHLNKHETRCSKQQNKNYDPPPPHPRKKERKNWNRCNVIWHKRHQQYTSYSQ